MLDVLGGCWVLWILVCSGYFDWFVWVLGFGIWLLLVLMSLGLDCTYCWWAVSVWVCLVVARGLGSDLLWVCCGVVF